MVWIASRPSKATSCLRRKQQPFSLMFVVAVCSVKKWPAESKPETTMKMEVSSRGLRRTAGGAGNALRLIVRDMILARLDLPDEFELAHDVFIARGLPFGW